MAWHTQASSSEIDIATTTSKAYRLMCPSPRHDLTGRVSGGEHKDEP
jgi:hypothetical protein